MEKFFDRLRNILVTPEAEWKVIADESEPLYQSLLIYIVPLSMLSSLPFVIDGQNVLEQLSITLSFEERVLIGVFVYPVSTVLNVLLESWIINWLAGKFGGEKNFRNAARLSIFSAIPTYLATAVNLLGFFLLTIAGSAYAFYLIWLGLDVMMKPASEHKRLYFAWIILVPIVPLLLAMIILALASLVVSGGQIPV
jgi:hypothetical protein